MRQRDTDSKGGARQNNANHCAHSCTSAARVVSRVENKEKKSNRNIIEDRRKHNEGGTEPVCPPAEHTPAATAEGLVFCLYVLLRYCAAAKDAAGQYQKQTETKRKNENNKNSQIGY